MIALILAIVNALIALGFLLDQQYARACDRLVIAALWLLVRFYQRRCARLARLAETSA